jgi:predicted nucleotidyltransferase
MTGRACKEFVRVLKNRFDAELVSVVLFGSAARGTRRPNSDIDVLVVMNGLPKSRLDRHGDIRAAARQVSEEFASWVSVVPLTPEEARDIKPFYLGMLSSHRILFDRGAFFRNVLNRLQRRLKELGSKRCVDEDGAEYWILKPDLKLGEAVVL